MLKLFAVMLGGRAFGQKIPNGNLLLNFFMIMKLNRLIGWITIFIFQSETLKFI